MGLAAFHDSPDPIDYPFYPSIMWSLGGEAWKVSDPEGTRIELPPGYSLGFYKREPMPWGDGLVFVPNQRFDLIVFLPHAEDLASERRLIDFDGEDILVR